jgi:uncharacterized membrane protein
MIVGGMGTATFLMLAGVAVGLSAGSKFRRSGNAAAAAGAVVRRGFEIYALGLVFRLQAFVLGWSSNFNDLLKVDILNIMGPSIVFAALFWRAGGSLRSRSAIFAAATVATAFATPAIRSAPLQPLPDFLEAYLVPIGGATNFVFFPWTALVFAGAFAGVLIDAAGSRAAERRLNLWLGAGGVALAALAYAASHLPAVAGPSYFWTSSPAYLFIRAGIVAAGIAGAYAWTARFVRPERWSPLITFGRTSLFIYWIHVELVYGLVSRPLHHALSLTQAWIAYAVFSAAMLGCSVLKERIVARRAPRPQRSAAAA